MKTLILDAQYFPSIHIWLGINDYDKIIFDSGSSFRKMSLRNRCWVAGAEGSLRLTIPLIGGRDQRKPMHLIQIDHSYPWQIQHWRTLTACYNRSPWFEYYVPSLEILFSNQSTSLVEWNMQCFLWILKQLSLNTKLCSEEKISISNEDETIVDFRDCTQNYQAHLKKDNIISYSQVFEDRIGFVDNLSILDLLFCEGPRAKKLLMK